ncbi:MULTISPECIES: PIN domain-containing protein [unclassified Roseateles]|uniref:PIN domain-containing protein n=1 Tax=unclassified Roseateles TaxID=2626991 RepID=UPI0006FF80EC|nr:MULTISPECIES: PIN domain-containing protein [unclassified Roseateles]KQW46584.1 twitching motility protein PilT [Pelomonas sp. Root405]KRA73635.1 twitching motility protein PilT [Pelomonas sp. Root662]
MFLLDTSIVLELRKAKAGQSDPGLAAWAADIARQKLFISALTLLEIENAAARLGRKDRAAGLVVRDWIDNRVMPAFEGRVLPVDATVVRRRAQLPYANTRDGLLAATALEHGLTFVTHRVSAFRVGRVKLLNPSGYVAPPSDEDEDWSHGTQTGHQWLKNLYVRA